MKLPLRFSNIIIIMLFHVLVVSCHLNKPESKKIDRLSLINRHNVTVNSFDTLASLSIGNGKFAFTVDATGLQTYPENYKNGVCLGTMSEWGWHSFPNTENYRLEESYEYYPVEDRQVPYAVQLNEPLRKKNAGNYFRQNPHRLHLGIIGFELYSNSGSAVKTNEITQISQKLNLWEGAIKSSFRVENNIVTTKTICHPEKDLIGTTIKSLLLKEKKIGIKIRFPYPSGNHTDDGVNWENSEKHHSEIITQNKRSAVFMHTIDSIRYFVKFTWTGNASWIQKEPHYFVLMPATNNNNFSFTAEFNPVNNFSGDLNFEDVRKSTVKMWKNYWETGGAVDFSGTTDPRAFELERRIVLSQYLERIQCAGEMPPQETGLTFNSWFGKPHLEMHWWHGVHWAYWNHTALLEKSLNYYSNIFEKAKHKAEVQGYKGVRWPKMTDPNGGDSPSGVGEFLIWQQPHFIYYAELMYREHPDSLTLKNYLPLVVATADFMADFARWDEKNQRFILGPPLIPAQESLEKEKTFNPPFEVAYWHWGLTTAQKWLSRLNLTPNPDWQAVIDGLPPFAQKDSLYLAAESAPDSYENERYYSDHPMVLGAFGILPGTVALDTTIMKNTFDYIDKNWNWPRTWGWDYPMAAMCATRLGKPEQAVNILLKEVQKNTYLKNGHNYQGGRLTIYLPGNGGLLTAIAMMCAGYEGNTKPNSGFPENWNVQWENLKPVF